MNSICNFHLPLLFCFCRLENSPQHISWKQINYLKMCYCERHIDTNMRCHCVVVGG
jgi:hypothetical protein